VSDSLGLRIFKSIKEMDMSRLFLWSGKRTALSVAVLAASALATGTANAWTSLPSFNAPGISQPGFPDFTDSNTNTLNVEFGLIGGKTKSIDGYTAPTGDYLLTAYSTVPGAFNTSLTSYQTIWGEAFGMYAVFNSKGQFISGGETIYGCSPPGTKTCKTPSNLYTTSFDKYGVSTSTVGLGFDTVYSSASGWAKQYQHGNESFYLYAAALAPLDNALKAGKNLPTWFQASGVNGITTVPLPAAGWLFGPAFAALFGVMRRRRPGPAVLDTASA
jgi:hypothetical protein